MASFRRHIEQAGADALELNIYDVVTDLDVSGIANEGQLSDVVKALKGDPGREPLPGGGGTDAIVFRFSWP
jgi:hypothetical protein